MYSDAQLVPWVPARVFFVDQVERFRENTAYRLLRISQRTADFSAKTPDQPHHKHHSQLYGPVPLS